MSCSNCPTCKMALGSIPTADLLGGQEFALPEDCTACGHAACKGTKDVPFSIAERMYYFLEELSSAGFVPEEYEEEVVEALERFSLWLAEENS